jgi:hypothetical protein
MTNVTRSNTIVIHGVTGGSEVSLTNTATRFQLVEQFESAPPAADLGTALITVHKDGLKDVPQMKRRLNRGQTDKCLA